MIANDKPPAISNHIEVLPIPSIKTFLEWPSGRHRRICNISWVWVSLRRKEPLAEVSSTE